MKRQQIFGLSMILMSVLAGSLAGQTTIESSMDWSTGIFRLNASRPLAPGLSPDDHPRALEDLERELKPLAVAEFSSIAWDNQGTMKDLMNRDPSARTAVEALARALEREWSRLSDDYKYIEAAYVADLSEEIPVLFPSASGAAPLQQPAGWRAVPEDDWTGILIYVPDGLPVRGTGLVADVSPALKARILTDGLEVLTDPSVGAKGILSYLVLEEREMAEELVGRRPFRAMARGLYGDSPCDIILSENDATDILASESGRRALTEGRIIILLDESTD